MISFTPLGFALILAMQTPIGAIAAETAVPDRTVAVDENATDENPVRRLPEAQRGRRDPADAPPNLRDFDPAFVRPQIRDRDRPDRPPRRRADSDAADQRPRIPDRDVENRPPRRRADSDVADDRPRSRDVDVERERRTVIMRLQHVPAKDTASTLGEWVDLEAEATGQVAPTVVAVPISNSLMVTGEPRQVREIDRIVRQLDQAPTQIQVKALLVNLSLPENAEDFNELGPFEGDISQIIAQMKARGELRVLAQSELLAGDNQAAFVMAGRRVPRVTGTSATPRGRSNRVEYENVGTTFGVTSRVADDERITLDIDVERSGLGSESEGTPLATGEQADGPRARQVETVSMQTTTTLRSGETAVLGGLIYKDEQGPGQILVLVQPTIMKP